MATRDFPNLEEIYAQKEMLDAMDILDEFNINYDRLDTLDELTERLILEYNRQLGVNVKADVSKMIMLSL